MKKIILFLLICVCMSVQAHAQGNFPKYLVSFKETKIPITFFADEMTKNLAWEFALEESPYTKPEKAFILPIAFYKVSENVAVLVTADTTEDTKSGSLSIQTYNIKKGKLIDQFRVLAGTFSEDAGMVCVIEISDKGTLTFTTKGLITKTKNVFEVNKKGKLKDLN